MMDVEETWEFDEDLFLDTWLKVKYVVYFLRGYDVFSVLELFYSSIRIAKRMVGILLELGYILLVTICFWRGIK